MGGLANKAENGQFAGQRGAGALARPESLTKNNGAGRRAYVAAVADGQLLARGRPRFGEAATPGAARVRRRGGGKSLAARERKQHSSESLRAVLRRQRHA